MNACNTPMKQGVKGFQFEPERSLATEEPGTLLFDDEELLLLPSTDSREQKAVTNWCKCGKCEVMPSSQECICCTEIDEIQYVHLEGIKCITEHEDFYPIVLLKNNLWTALVALHDRESRGLTHKDKMSNRPYRYAAYRQFCWFIHNRLGKGVRRVIPSCVVSRIRREYPSESYTGFTEAGQDDPSEMDFACVFKIPDED